MSLFDKPVRITIPAIAAMLSFVLMTSLAGCTENIDPESVEDEVHMSLRLDEAFQEAAYIRFVHDGDASDFWYYMVTEDLESDARGLLEARIAEVLASAGEIVGNVGVNKSLLVENLSAKTEYRVIAAILSEAGEILGEVAVLDFVTLRNPDVFEVNPDWNITYKGREVVENPYSETDVFTCSVSEGSEECYIPCLLTKSDFRNAYASNLRKCFEDYIAYRRMENLKWTKDITAEPVEYVQDRLRHDDYILFMIGVDMEGSLTGYYAMTECKIEQEEASEEYLKWLGDWTVTGENGDVRFTYDVEIAPDENNMYYRMYGWEGTTATGYFEDVPDLLPVQLYFEKTSGDVYVVSEELAELPDPTIAQLYDFYLYGCVEIESGPVPVDYPNIRIAKFRFTDDRHATVIPEIFKFDMNGRHYEEPFVYFCYTFISTLYNGLVPMTPDAKVPLLNTMKLEKK